VIGAVRPSDESNKEILIGKRCKKMQIDEGVWTSDPQGNPVFIPIKNKTAWEPQQTPLNNQQVNTQLQYRQSQPVEQIMQEQQPAVEQRYSWSASKPTVSIPSWIANQQSKGNRFPPVSPFEVRIREGWQNTQGRPMFHSLRQPESFSRPLTSNVFSRKVYSSPLFGLQQYTETEVDNQTGEIVSQRKRFFQPRIVARI
jgi:hypothetical protein